jgi:hypothetical protein
MITAKTFAQRILEEADFHLKSTPLKDFITKKISEFDPKLTELQIMESLENKMASFIDELIAKQEEVKESGLISPFEIFQNEKKIIGYSTIRPNDSIEQKKIREIASQIKEVLSCIQKISAQDFEKLSGKLLMLWGASSYVVTDSTRDKGIDFIGIMENQNKSNIVDKIFIIGQSKNYPNTSIGENFIRELLGSYFLIKFDLDIIKNLWKSSTIDIKFNDPIKLMLVTSGKFSQNTKLLADKYGIILKDGLQIATDLAKNKICFDNDNGIFKFNKEKFSEWLKSG